VLDSLRGTKYFATFDLQSGYCQMRVTDRVRVLGLLHSMNTVLVTIGVANYGALVHVSPPLTSNRVSV